MSSLHYSLLFWCWTFDHLSVVLFLLGDQSDQKLALQNIASMVRPGGMLIIDHRNYDYILETGRAPQGKNIYYKVLIVLELWAACYDVIIPSTLILPIQISDDSHVNWLFAISHTLVRCFVSFPFLNSDRNNQLPNEHEAFPLNMVPMANSSLELQCTYDRFQP